MMIHYSIPPAFNPAVIVQEIISTMRSPLLQASSLQSTNPETYMPAASGSSTQKLIALTFDDGPYGTSTEEILSILESEHIHASFFLIGKNAEKYPDLVKRIYNDGDDIGNHSYAHLRTFSLETKEVFGKDVDTAEAAISDAIGIHDNHIVHPTLYRPPYGSLSETMKGVLAAKGYHIIMWDVDVRDWDSEKISTDMIVNGILAKIKSGSIVLLHDGRDTRINYPRENTIHALKPLITGLREKGYEFVTVTELLERTGTAGTVVHSREAARN
jgi:peptidoglycan/xylan/chitin deacetylase (PgdA/CDA1 family)